MHFFSRKKSFLSLFKYAFNAIICTYDKIYGWLIKKLQLNFYNLLQFFDNFRFFNGFYKLLQQIATF